MRAHTWGIALLVVAGACGNSAPGGSGDSDGSNQGPAGAFDACGGKIVKVDGSIDAAEYKKQAASFDPATLDCRLGPTFAPLHPGDSDSTRPMAAELPLTPRTGDLCPMFSNHDTP